MVVLGGHCQSGKQLESLESVSDFKGVLGETKQSNCPLNCTGVVNGTLGKPPSLWMANNSSKV